MRTRLDEIVEQTELDAQSLGWDGRKTRSVIAERAFRHGAEQHAKSRTIWQQVEPAPAEEKGSYLGMGHLCRIAVRSAREAVRLNEAGLCPRCGEAAHEPNRRKGERRKGGSRRACLGCGGDRRSGKDRRRG